MKDINSNITYCDTEQSQGSSNADAAAAYRQFFDQVVCPPEVCQAALKRCMEQQGTGKKTASQRRWRHPAMAACGLIVLCMLGVIFLGERMGYALGRNHRQGYIYEKEEYEGLKFTRTFVVYAKWNQKVAMGMQPQTGLYEGCYEDLQQLGMLEVLMPHYRVETYEQEKKEICSESYYKSWDCVYRDGDSRISMNIRYAPRTSAQSVVGMPDRHELIRVDGVEYDVQYFSRKPDYEEYVKMQQYSRKGDTDEQILSRDEYEEEHFYSVQIECMVNEISYCFRLTEDIDVQEFLESIYIQPSDREPEQDQVTGSYFGGWRPNTAAGGKITYEYTDVTYEGLELTSCYRDRGHAEQQVAITAQQPKNQYDGIYDELRDLRLLEVLLPHYQVDRYTLADSGSREIQFEREWYGIYEDGDSRIAITLQDLGEIVASKSTDMLSGHESRSVNGVEYEILYHSRPITYEEYLLMQQYRVAYSYEAWSCSRIEYEESYVYYPVEIICMVNGINYTFEISGDIDIEEFLESIY